MSPSLLSHIFDSSLFASAVSNFSISCRFSRVEERWPLLCVAALLAPLFFSEETVLPCSSRPSTVRAASSPDWPLYPDLTLRLSSSSRICSPSRPLSRPSPSEASELRPLAKLWLCMCFSAASSRAKRSPMPPPLLLAGAGRWLRRILKRAHWLALPDIMLDTEKPAEDWLYWLLVSLKSPSRLRGMPESAKKTLTGRLHRRS
mmetsp:Transcript_125664/g.305259  ORF Transcript_125664/g.305259 Transcript_125664/m.305259 type:complete len:203 (+) Transcript_125664:505-1113(+)